MKRLLAGLLVAAAAGLGSAGGPPDLIRGFDEAPDSVQFVDLTESDADGARAINVPWVRQAGHTGRGTLLGVVDSGIDRTHHEFEGAKIKAARDFTEAPATLGTDPVGHGTHVASIAAAAQNDFGLIGVAPQARLLDARALGPRGGALVRVADAIEWCAREGADVIVMSLGATRSHPEVEAAVAAADRAGVILVAAAGNGGPVTYPAAYPTVIAVGVHDSWGSRGVELFCVAPGARVRGAYPGPRGGLEAFLSGTSMAAPHVAGLALLWVRANQSLPRAERPEAFRRALAQACASFRNPITGYGTPDAAVLLGVSK